MTTRHATQPRVGRPPQAQERPEPDPRIEGYGTTPGENHPAVEEPPGRSGVPTRRDGYVDDLAMLVDGPVDVPSHAVDLDVGLVHERSPGQWRERLNRRCQRTVRTITSGGNRNPTNADGGGDQDRIRDSDLTGQRTTWPSWSRPCFRSTQQAQLRRLAGRGRCRTRRSRLGSDPVPRSWPVPARRASSRLTRSG